MAIEIANHASISGKNGIFSMPGVYESGSQKEWLWVSPIVLLCWNSIEISQLTTDLKLWKENFNYIIIHKQTLYGCHELITE